MAMDDKRKQLNEQEDDGRTIADMSNLAPHRNWLGGWTASTGSDSRREQPSPQPQQQRRPWEQPDTFTGSQRFWAVMGALKASLLIGLVYVVGLGLLGWLLISLWS